MEYVEVARARSDRGEIVLRQRRDPDAPETAPTALELRVNGVFVMDTVETTTETELARAALGQVESPRSVLIGGLGLGFTVHEVLADHRVEHVVVAEIEDALVQWFRDGTIPHGRPFLADGRLSISVADIQQVVEESAPERRSTWCCSTWTTGRTSWCSKATPGSTSPRSCSGCETPCAPGASSPSGRRRSRRGCWPP